MLFSQVADLFFVHQRGTMNGIYLAIVIIGNYVSISFNKEAKSANVHCSIKILILDPFSSDPSHQAT